MCKYLQINDLEPGHQDLPRPLLLYNSNDFYNLEQLTNQEKLFMQQIESFDNNTDHDNIEINPFDIDMTRVNNLFKIAHNLQIARLFTLIAGRHASLINNLNKTAMIQWFIDIKYSNPNVKNPISNINNNNYNC